MTRPTSTRFMVVILANTALLFCVQCCFALSLSLPPLYQPTAPQVRWRNKFLAEGLFLGGRGGDINDNPQPLESDDDLPIKHQRSFIGISLRAALVSVVAIGKVVCREIQSLTFHQRCFFVTTLAIGFCLGRLWPFWKRYTNVHEIPASRFVGIGSTKASCTLWGRVVTVSDGDGFRFLHRPTPFHPTRVRKGERVSEVALPVRICTIDAPETGKFGQPGQPFAQEAKTHLESLLVGKRVGIRVLRKDQYSRVVAEVFTSGRIRLPFFRTYVDEQMLQEGLAEIYTGGGAVYGKRGIHIYETLQAKAKKSKKGIWSLKNRESAAEYKKRHR